jgi:hypothetical protein
VHVTQVLSVSRRRACCTFGQHRSTQRKLLRGREDEKALTADIIALLRSMVISATARSPRSCGLQGGW